MVNVSRGCVCRCLLVDSLPWWQFTRKPRTRSSRRSRCTVWEVSVMDMVVQMKTKIWPRPFGPLEVQRPRRPLDKGSLSSFVVKDTHCLLFHLTGSTAQAVTIPLHAKNFLMLECMVLVKVPHATLYICMLSYNIWPSVSRSVLTPILPDAELPAAQPAAGFHFDDSIAPGSEPRDSQRLP